MTRSKKTYLAFDPERDIELGLEGESEVGYLMLENVSDMDIAFRFRTDNENYISVSPRKGILAPADYKEVRVVFTNAEFRKAPIRIQALAIPVEGGPSVGQRIKDVFQRASKSEIQDHRFIVFHGLGHGPPKHPLLPSQRQPFSDKTLEPAVPVLVPPLEGSALYTDGHLGSSDDFSAPWDRPNKMRYGSNYRPSSEGSRGRKSAGSSNTDISTLRRSREGSLPHYDLHMSSEEAAASQSRFPLGRRLLKKFSQMGAVISELTEQSRLLRSSQRWAFALFWLVLVLLILLVYFLVIYPVWWKLTGHSRNHHLGTAAEGHIRMSDLSDTFIEDRTAMSLDEYIHWRMN